MALQLTLLYEALSALFAFVGLVVGVPVLSVEVELGPREKGL